MYHFQLLPTRRENRSISSLNASLEKFFDGYFTPTAEIVEHEKSYSIALDIPGFSKENVSIEVENKKLTVAGERTESARKETDVVLRQERKFGQFHRVFNLPDNIQDESIQAKFENGVLTINLPKTEKSPGRKITIDDGAESH